MLTFVPGQQYDVVALSFDAREKPELAAAKKAVYMKDLGTVFGKSTGAEKGWHFLTGDIDEIKKVTDAVGFHYKWDVNTAQFAHASAIYVLTPDGKLSKYFYGIDYSPKEMRFALVEASHGKIGSAVDRASAVLLPFRSGFRALYAVRAGYPARGQVPGPFWRALGGVCGDYAAPGTGTERASGRLTEYART